MLFGLLLTLFIFVCIFLILMVLVQKGKGSVGLGGLGGGSQMLFGGSGGQDIFQKITWVLGALFIFGSLALALMKSVQYQSSHYLGRTKTVEQQPLAPVEVPQETQEQEQ